jgi:hypothetical protein
VSAANWGWDAQMMQGSMLAIGCALVVAAIGGANDGTVAQGEPARTQLDCAYSPRQVDDVVLYKNCASLDAAGVPRLAPRHLAALRFDRRGLASLWLGNGFYYVARDGRVAPVMALDNWADAFADGLARSPRGGKIGYIDRTLCLAIPATYDGAFPFHHGRAVVCRGCVIQKTDEDSTYVGGLWGCIGTDGRETTPLTRLSFSAAGC